MPLGITETKRPEENYFWEVTIPGFSGKHMTYRLFKRSFKVVKIYLNSQHKSLFQIHMNMISVKTY